ncbi:MAG TPA: polysaccharide biosynthesis/export family protein [Gammaproteobacteria bacterium]
MKLQELACMAAGVLLLGLAACADQPTMADNAQCHGDNCRVDKYLIGPGDVLHVSVWKDQGLDRVITVRPDGMISFPLVNDVQASGQTPQQLQKTLTDKLKQYMSEPEVSVVVQEVHSYAVSVLGEVKTPGRYELKGQATVLDVLAQAGGLTEFASPSRIVVLRDQDGSKRRILFDYDDAVYSNSAQPFYVRPGDIITVP